MSDTDHKLYRPIGERRHARHIDLPLDGRLKMRLGRAITNALINPVRCNPTLRRTVIAVSSALRSKGFTDEGICERFTHVIQSIALDGGSYQVTRAIGAG